MSITGHGPRVSDEEKKRSEKFIEEFLKKGGKIKQIPEGEFTEAKDMKYKYRRGAKKKTNE